MFLQNCDRRDRKGPWNSHSEGLKRWIVRNTQKTFSVYDPAQQKAQIIGDPADPIPHNTRKRSRKFLRKDLEGEDLIVATEVHSKRSRKEHILV